DAIALRLRALCLYTLLTRHPPSLTLFPYTTLFRSDFKYRQQDHSLLFDISKLNTFNGFTADSIEKYRNALPIELCVDGINGKRRSEEHTSELQSRFDLVCRLLLEKKNKKYTHTSDQ